MPEQTPTLDLKLERDLRKLSTESNPELTTRCNVINPHSSFNVEVAKTVKTDEIKAQDSPLIMFINNYRINKLKLKKYISNYTGIDAVNKMYKMVNIDQVIKNISIPSQMVKKQNNFKVIINNLNIRLGLGKPNKLQILQILENIRIKIQSLENLRTLIEIENSNKIFSKEYDYTLKKYLPKKNIPAFVTETIPETKTNSKVEPKPKTKLELWELKPENLNSIFIRTFKNKKKKDSNFRSTVKQTKRLLENIETQNENIKRLKQK